MAEASNSAATWGWTSYFTEIATFIQSSERQFGRYVNQQFVEYVVGRLTGYLRHITDLRQHIADARQTAGSEEGRSAIQSLVSSLDQLLHLLHQLIQQWQQHLESIGIQRTSSRYNTPRQQSPGPGRPSFTITQEQLVHLRSLSFTWTDISRMLGVSRMTLHRRREEYGLLPEPSQSVSEGQLVTVVQNVRQELPDIGQSMVDGTLRAVGIQVPRERIREISRRTDPLNTALRWHSRTTRQPYSVPGPNSLWHIGMYMNLIKACSGRLCNTT